MVIALKFLDDIISPHRNVQFLTSNLQPQPFYKTTQAPPYDNIPPPLPFPYPTHEVLMFNEKPNIFTQLSLFFYILHYSLQQQNMKDGDGEGPFCAMCEMVLGQLTSLVTDRRLQVNASTRARALCHIN